MQWASSYVAPLHTFHIPNFFLHMWTIANISKGGAFWVVVLLCLGPLNCFKVFTSYMLLAWRLLVAYSLLAGIHPVEGSSVDAVAAARKRMISPKIQSMMYKADLSKYPVGLSPVHLWPGALCGRHPAAGRVLRGRRHLARVEETVWTSWREEVQ